MKKGSIIIFLFLAITLAGCKATQSELTLLSPNSQNRVELNLSQTGEISYLIYHNNSTIVDTSFISFDFKDQEPLRANLTVVKSSQSSFSETWELPWGEQREVINNYNEMGVRVLRRASHPKRRLNIYLRAYDDGVASVMSFYLRPVVDSLIIMEENTEFQLTGDHTAWWIPGDWDSYEHLYNTTPISKVDAMKHNNAPGLGFTNIMDNAVHTPVTMRTNEGVHISIHEAALIDYASMTLKVDTSSLKLTSQLVGSERLGYKVKRGLPFKTPWRTIQIADKASELIESRLILNLNEPNKLGDVSWVKPMKYMGIWWEMHIDKGSWDYGMTLDEESGKWVDTGQESRTARSHY